MSEISKKTNKKPQKHNKDTYRPSTEQIDQEIAAESGGEHLGDDVQVGDQS